MSAIFQVKIWYPNCQNNDSIERVIERLLAVQKVVNGTLEPDVFLDILDNQGFDVFDLLNKSEV